MRVRAVSAAFVALMLVAGTPAPDVLAGGQETSCASDNVHCVGDGQEFRDIQHAVDAAGPGHLVYVTAGDYSGFRVRRSGAPERPLRIVAAAGRARKLRTVLADQDSVL